MLLRTFYAVAALADDAVGAPEADHIVAEDFSVAAAGGPLEHTNVTAVGRVLAIICTEGVLERAFIIASVAPLRRMMSYNAMICTDISTHAYAYLVRPLPPIVTLRSIITNAHPSNARALDTHKGFFRHVFDIGSLISKRKKNEDSMTTGSVPNSSEWTSRAFSAAMPKYFNDMLTGSRAQFSSLGEQGCRTTL